MPYRQLCLLAPCHGIEDFPLYHTGANAESVLSCWTTLWHPRLLQESGKLPRVERSDYSSADLTESLLLLPLPFESDLDRQLPTRANEQQAVLIRGLSQRAEILAQVFAYLPEGRNEPAAIDDELVKEFFALGFTYFQIQLLTQQMRYSSTLNRNRLQTEAIAAANAACQGDIEASRRHLQSSFDLLADERNHYYPVDIYLLDLTLVPPIRPGTESTAVASIEALRRTLTTATPTTPLNWAIDGQTLAQWRGDTDWIAEIRTAVTERRLAIVGGEFEEFPFPLMTYDSISSQIHRGLNVFDELLQNRPDVFVRRCAGLFPGLQQVLLQHRYRGAAHFWWDGGRAPATAQSKAKWTFHDQELDVLGKPPLDASAHESFLNMASALSEAMDRDHVAARAWIHWGGTEACWYEDLRTSMRYGHTLGTFITFHSFFRETGESGERESFSIDSYRYPYLQQAVSRNESDPLSSSVRYWQSWATLQQTLGGTMLCRSLGSSQETPLDEIEGTSIAGLQALAQESWRNIRHDLKARMESSPSSGTTSRSLTVANPFAFPRRVLVETGTWIADGTGSGVYASQLEPDGRKLALVDLPSLGFVRLQEGHAKPIPGPLLGENLTLRNEFLQAEIDPHTGGLRVIKDYQLRNARMSQQLALRIAKPKTGQAWLDRQAVATYSVMVADRVTLEVNGRIEAVIVSQGRLCDEHGGELARFEQRYRLLRGSRVLDLDIDLTPTTPLLDDPWDSYYACRFAWKDETASLVAGVRLQGHPIEKKKIEAPLFVEVLSGNGSTSIFPGGLPYHRRVAENRLDSLLVVQGETLRSFRFGLGVDVPYPARAALERMTNESPVSASGKVGGGWLFHLDAKNILATGWQALPNDAGFRVRLTETSGRGAVVHLHAYKPPRDAALIDGEGDTLSPLQIDDHGVTIPMQAYQWLEVQVRW